MLAEFTPYKIASSASMAIDANWQAMQSGTTFAFSACWGLPQSPRIICQADEPRSYAATFFLVPYLLPNYGIITNVS